MWCGLTWNEKINIFHCNHEKWKSDVHFETFNVLHFLVLQPPLPHCKFMRNIKTFTISAQRAKDLVKEDTKI